MLRKLRLRQENGFLIKKVYYALPYKIYRKFERI